MLGGGLGALGGDLGKKNGQDAVLVDFGQARVAENGGKMAELGAKMGSRWRQDGACLAILRPVGSYLEHFGGLGGDLCRNG